MSDPQSQSEWQEAVNAAEALLLIDSARQYGLITGGPEIDAGRCADILARGKQRGVHPDKCTVHMMILSLACTSRALVR